MTNNQVIQSLENPRIKAVRKLYQKKYRNQSQSFLVEGEKILLEVLQHQTLHPHYIVKELYTSESFTYSLICSEMLEGIPHWSVTDKIFANLSALQSPRGCIAVIEHKPFALDDAILGNASTNQVFLLDGIQDPGNVGTIIRIADAVQAQAVVLGHGCADPFSDKVVRAAMGSLFHLPVLELSLVDAIRRLRTSGYTTLAADLEGTPYYSLEISDRIAIVLGSEGQGISEHVKQEIDRLVTIPMPGNAESLNVSVAAGILAFDLVRRREFHD